MGKGVGLLDLCWASCNQQRCCSQDFVITNSVRRNLQNIVRMLSGGRFPILLEGPTSSGKTSLVRFLARLTGHEFVRINNHEHTDLQEYVGQYVCDPITGQLVFQEGVLVRAARAGHWVVLDELNLAPSEVLEALNRLLDDNRELYIPDTGATVKPHPEFMVFATQNPAGGLYGGRKLLSRAFRNRFTEVFISELPMDELAAVIHHRCKMPPSYVRAMLAVYQDLQSHRCHSCFPWETKLYDSQRPSPLGSSAIILLPRARHGGLRASSRAPPEGRGSRSGASSSAEKLFWCQGSAGGLHKRSSG